MIPEDNSPLLVEPAQTAAVASLSSPEQVLSSMKRSILKIITGLSIVSVVGVALVLWLGSLAGSGLESAAIVSDQRANYAVPAQWGSEQGEDNTIYFEGVTPESSLASIVVSVPTRVTFEKGILSEAQAINVLEQFVESNDSLRDDGIELSVRSKIFGTEYVHAFEYNVRQVAGDGETPVLGRLQIRFDESNYIHVIEVAAVQPYWSKNAPRLLQFINSYSSLSLGGL